MIKYLLAVLFGLLSISIFSQIININNTDDAESFDSLQTLIENVFISGDCAIVNNFSEKVHGAASALNSKSYGYFSTPAGSDFPFESGVVLSTGYAIRGGNTTTGVTASQSYMTAGDADLEDALSMTTTNDATFIKFNFQSITSTINFRYIMASEEYGDNTECEFWDGFAFLLREVGTTAYTNLAVLPNDTPVSVNNINNSTNCANNPTYFEGYNVPDTNYGGRTKILTATASVIPNQLYEMKIVIADQGDFQFDTAIFLEAGSFNLGANLGTAHLSSENSAICGTEKLLDINISASSYAWFKDNVLIPEATSETYLANLGNGNYKVKAIVSAGCIAESEINLEFVTSASATADIPDLFACFDGDDTAIFDLTERKDTILGTQSDSEFEVHYFSDASYSFEITTPTSFEAIGGTVYVRVVNSSSNNCTADSSFNIGIAITEAALPEDISKIEYCDNDDDGNAFNGVVSFDLEDRKTVILNGFSDLDYTLTYFTNDAYTDEILSANVNTYMNTSAVQTIYVQMTNNLDINCFDRTSFEIEVFALPNIINTLEFNVCDDDSDSSNETLVNLTNLNSHISNNSENEIFLYFESLDDAENNSSFITNSENYMGTDGDTIWLRVISSEGCFDISQIDINVTITNLDVYNTTLLICDDFIENVSNDQDGISEFDLTQVSSDVLNLFPQAIRSDLNISFYPAPFSNIQLQTNLITAPHKYRNPNGTTLVVPDRVYIKIENKNNLDCAGMSPDLYIDLRVHETPYFEINSQVMCISDLPKPIQVTNPKNTYTYVWKDDNGILLETDTDSTDIAFIPKEGTYTVTASNDTCSRTETFDVQISSSPKIKTLTVFDNLKDNRISIEVEGFGTYEYAIDSSEFVSGNEVGGHVFEHLKEGLHTIHIRDIKNNCVALHREVVIIRFPKHVTPNHDGVNDTFYVYGGSALDILTVSIFDKQGRIITILKQNEQWNGTYLGNLLPKADYWFRIEFMDRGGLVREYKGHFSLIH